MFSIDDSLRVGAGFYRASLKVLLMAALFLLPGSTADAVGDGADFQATSDYTLRLGDETIEDATVFYSARQVAYLVISDRLSRPLIVRIPEEEVVEMAAEAIDVDEQQGVASVASTAGENKLDGFERRLKEIRFQLGETPAALIPAPPIIGWRSPQTLRSKSLVMSSGFSRTKKSALAPKTLAIPPDRELLVEVFFGSWDDYSQLVMPKIMQLEEELAASSVRFRYYGLPRRIADDPLGVERSVHGVPTMIVREGDAEVGRLVGRSLAAPGESLERMLRGELE